jgi:hypothetical protein
MSKSRHPPIVDDQKIADVKAALGKIADAIPVIPKLKAVGVDTTDYEKTLQHYETHLTNILKTFTTGK